MIPPTFDYDVATTVDHAVQLLAEHGPDAKLMAGGHSLIPLMKLRLSSPAFVIDIGRLRDLAFVRDGGDHLAIGALTSHRQLANDPIIREACGLLGVVAATIGDVQVRERGTIGGSIAHGDPAADLPAALVALDATIVAVGPGGERTIPVIDFFETYLTTALADDEVLTEIRVPKLGDRWGWHYEKFVKRTGDWAIVGVAAAIRHDDGTIAESRIGLTNMGSTPVRASAVEQALGGVNLDDRAALDAAVSHVVDGTDPTSDLNGTREYRQHLAGVLTRRAVLAASGR